MKREAIVDLGDGKYVLEANPILHMIEKFMFRLVNVNESVGVYDPFASPPVG